jgi:hypothetical protein
MATFKSVLEKEDLSKETKNTWKIYNAVYTHEEYLPDLRQWFLERLYETTEIKVGVKVNPENPCPEPKLGDIDYEWAKIKPI